MTERQKRIKKVKALLAMTMENGASEAEAMFALATARRIMDDEGIDDNDLNFGGESVVEECVVKTDHDKARFRMYFVSPVVDIGRQLQEASSAEGSAYVVRKQMKAAGVPDETIEKVLAHSDPILVRNLAQELTMLPETTAKVDALAGAQATVPGADPLSTPPTPSGGAASTGPESAPVSTPSTEASTTPA